MEMVPLALSATGIMPTTFIRGLDKVEIHPEVIPQVQRASILAVCRIGPNVGFACQIKMIKQQVHNLAALTIMSCNLSTYLFYLHQLYTILKLVTNMHCLFWFTSVKWSSNRYFQVKKTYNQFFFGFIYFWGHLSNFTTQKNALVV